MTIVSIIYYIVHFSRWITNVFRMKTQQTEIIVVEEAYWCFIMTHLSRLIKCWIQSSDCIFTSSIQGSG